MHKAAVAPTTHIKGPWKFCSHQGHFLVVMTGQHCDGHTAIDLILTSTLRRTTIIALILQMQELEHREINLSKGTQREVAELRFKATRVPALQPWAHGHYWQMVWVGESWQLCPLFLVCADEDTKTGPKALGEGQSSFLSRRTEQVPEGQTGVGAGVLILSVL